MNADIDSLFQQATTAYADGQPELAETLARRLIGLDSRHADAHYLAGAIRLDAGDADAALPLLEAAARLNPVHPGIQYALGNAHYILEHWPEAIRFYEHLRQLGRADNVVFLNLAVALHKIQQTDTAVQVLNQGTRAFPSDPALWNAYGDMLNKQNDDRTSIMAHERAVALMPDHPDYSANLALIYEQSNRMEDAERVATGMLEHHPQHELLLLVCARCARRKKEYRKALSLLDRMAVDASLKFKRASLFEIGRIHDLLQDSDKAYACFVAGNKLSLKLWPDHEREAAKYMADWQTIRTYLDAHSSLSWPVFNAELDRPKLVFLFGFMRSGTTLMDTILETHTRITVLEEQPPTRNVIQATNSLAGGYPSCMEHLTHTQVETLRQQYWKGVMEFTGVLSKDTIVLDKQPMLGAHIGLVHRLFPDAQFIFALRHPCDVILSNFMQPFGNNPFHAHFTTLEQCAKIYSLIMEMWLSYQKRLNLNVHTLRYEDLINEKQKTLSAVFEFLGLDDAPTDIDHVSHAKNRGRIYTPSYHQVVQPLYSDAMERWRRYRTYFEPILPMLRPYAERFGYTL
jgi:tetratricopeptide (TPR) repeat protein